MVETIPQRIERWVRENFTEHVDREAIVEDLIDVAAGNREAACEFERKAVAAVMSQR